MIATGKVLFANNPGGSTWYYSLSAPQFYYYPINVGGSTIVIYYNDVLVASSVVSSKDSYGRWYYEVSEYRYTASDDTLDKRPITRTLIGVEPLPYSA